jgi:hypothetical protein
MSESHEAAAHDQPERIAKLRRTQPGSNTRNGTVEPTTNVAGIHGHGGDPLGTVTAGVAAPQARARLGLRLGRSLGPRGPRGGQAAPEACPQPPHESP